MKTTLRGGLALLLAAAAPAGAQTLTLSAAVDRALRASPVLEQARARLAQAQAASTEARLASLPRLSAKAAATRGDDPVYAFSSLLQQRRFGAQNFAIDSLNEPGYLTNVKSSLELGLPLFTGFALRDGRELARLQAQAAGAAADAAAQRLRGEVADAYLRVLLGRALAAEAGERVAAAAADLEDARKLRARGLVLGSDFYAAQAQLSALRARRVQAESRLAGARAALAELLGGEAGEPAGSLEDAAYSTGTVTAILETAARERRDLKQAAAGESAAAVLARRERRSLLPTVDAFASLETDTHDFSSNPTSRLIGVRATLPFGDPAYFERARRASEAGRAAQAGRAAAEQQARLEVRRRWQEYEEAAELVPVLREAADEAQRSLELFRPLYREGRQSILDVLKAEDALLRARAAYSESLYGAHGGWARLQVSAGVMDSAAVAELERRLGAAR
jgi:outer membrane protein